MNVYMKIPSYCLSAFLKCNTNLYRELQLYIIKTNKEKILYILFDELTDFYVNFYYSTFNRLTVIDGNTFE